MDRPELLSLLRSAHDEIVMLRRRLEVAEPKAQAYDNINTIIGMIPAKSQGYGVDVAWCLETAVEAIVKERAAERAAGEAAAAVG